MATDYSNYYSIIAFEKDGVTTCTVQFTPKGRKYVVKCPPEAVPGRINALIEKEIQRRERRIQLLRHKQKKVMDILWRAPKGVFS
jgi:hypothetical protein